MNIIFRVDANIQIGTGHLMRCVALAQAWKKDSDKILFISTYKNKALRKVIKDKGIIYVDIEKSNPDPSDLEETLSTIQHLPSNNNWFVLDGYHFDTEYHRGIKGNGNLLLIIDDTAHLDNYFCDILLNQNINAHKLHYSCEPNTKFLLGTNYALLRDEFLGWKNWKRTIPKVGKKVLVTMGGGDPDNVTLKVIQAFQKFNINELEVKVVIGPSNPYLNELKKESVNHKHNIELLQNAINMPDLMAWADVVISSGGSTCLELAFMGLPAILIVTAENQEAVATELDEYGSVIDLGWFFNVATEKITESIIKLLRDVQLRKKMSQRGFELVDGDGVKRVISNMNVILQNDRCYLRLANEKDAELLWHWANDPAVRNNSFNPKYIQLEQHLKWFNEKLNTDATRIWILEYDHESVGQIRYDRVNDSTAEISFSVSKNKRGVGFGAKLILMTCETAFKELKIEKIKGVTFATNIPSLKAFEKAGFKLVRQENIENHICNIYMKYDS